MYYLTLTSDKLLIATQTSPIYRGENLSDSVRIIIPKVVESVSLETATVFLNYVRSDRTGDLDLLIRADEEYDETHYQYLFPIDSKLTRLPGEICIWLTIYSGSPCAPTITKSSEYTMIVSSAKNSDDYIDSNATAIYKLKTRIDEVAKQIPDDLKIAPDLSGESTRLHLSVEDMPIGVGVPYSTQSGGGSTPPDPDDDGMIEFDKDPDTSGDDGMIEF